MPVAASDAWSRPRAIDGRWTSAKGMHTSTMSTGFTVGPRPGATDVGESRSGTSRGADARRLAIALMECPGFLEPADGTRDRAVILMHPFVVLPHLGEQSRLLLLLVRREPIQIGRVLLELRHGRRLDPIDSAAKRVARHTVADCSDVMQVSTLRVRHSIPSGKP